VQTAFEGKQYEIILLPVRRFAKKTQTYMILIDDITQPLDEIGSATRENILIGVSGLIVSELLLLALLWTPMTRLRRTADTLPLLGQGAFERARSAIRKRVRGHWIRDEIDILDTTAIGLSQRLEKLEQDVLNRTRALAERMDELRRERDFVKGLLDTAQVIILTQNAEREIMMVNDYGQSLSGFTQERLFSKDFTKLIASDQSSSDIPECLAEIAGAKREQLRHEAQLLCNDGSTRDVAWLHSRLGGRSKNEPVILSVGLDVTDQKHAERRLSWLADHDSLSGLLNRRSFQEELERALAVSKRYGTPGALLFFDLDQFKYINDTSGHQAGDMLLKMVAETLARIVRDTDVIGRLGGDEFAVLMAQTDADGAIRAANKVGEHLSTLELPIGEHSHKISASIGVALFPKHGTEVHDLLAVADMAMYHAKDSGRGRWHLFSRQDQSRERMREHVVWKDRVEKALAADRFVLYYQPIFDLRTDQVTHAEALLRMVDTDGTVITPGAFMDACERTGLIHAIDHLVLRKGIAQVADLIAAGRDIRVSLNLSGRAFEDPDLLQTLQESLTRHQVDPDRIIFEITETAAVADLAAARGLMNQMRKMGCSFALDDFGTGFSSLRYLKQLPVDYVKLDGSFIRNLPNSNDDQILVKAMAEVARGFGKRTIAEFVETGDVLPFLREYGVDLAQGYFVGRPADLSAASAYPFESNKRQHLG
jgi:diguanylate cyclase (GGDEF)-like protein/PAS domain S-box-containing protein